MFAMELGRVGIVDAVGVLSKPRIVLTLEFSEKSAFVTRPFSATKLVRVMGVGVVPGRVFVAVNRVQFVGEAPFKLKSTPMSAPCSEPQLSESATNVAEI
jgi:hypothetical protein